MPTRQEMRFLIVALVISSAMIVTFGLSTSAYAVSAGNNDRSDLGFQQSNPQIAQPGVIGNLTGAKEGDALDIALDFIKWTNTGANEYWFF